jgi:hypothetical protein
MTLQTQRCNQNKNLMNGSGDIALLIKRKEMLSNFHNHIFCSLQTISVHFDDANAETYLKQGTN